MSSGSAARAGLALGVLARGLVSLVMNAQVLFTVVLFLVCFGALLGSMTAAWLVENVSPTLPPDRTLVVVAAGGVLGAAGLLCGWYRSLRKQIRRGRSRLLADARPADPDEDAAFVDAVTRLAGQVDSPVPDLRVLPVEVPLCFTVRSEGEAVVVVSTGLRERLDSAEFEAVLAHEVAHLANADHRLMTWTVAPLLAAEEFADTYDADTWDPRELPWALFGKALVLWSRLATCLFSRGREYAADRGAARLTGEPAALASALERLDGTATGAPQTDLRRHATAVDSLSVLPALDPARDAGGGLLATHPPTEDRVDRLRELEARRG